MENSINSFVFFVCTLFSALVSASGMVDMTVHESDELEGEVFFQENTPCNKPLPADAVGWTADCKAIFPFLPVAYVVMSSGNGPRTYGEQGSFIDMNGDGLLDYVVSYFEIEPPNQPYFKGIFMNSGNSTWIMESCKSNNNGGWGPQGINRFPDCP